MIPRTIFVAPDAFKGTMPAAVVARAIGRGLESAGRPVDLCPVADGGEGTMEILLQALGGEVLTTFATDPLGRPLQAAFALTVDRATAIVELASASGLDLLPEAERDAEAASTAGTGQVMLAAARAGARTIMVAAGGSATTDGGRAALEAIESGGGLGEGVSVLVLCDVQIPFEDAPARFGPQKGADPAAVARLRRRLDRYAERLPRDPRGRPMTGAAGGFAGGMWAGLGARLVPGAPFVLEAISFDPRLRAARAVIIGEGRLDATTLHGKIAFEIATRARQGGIPAYAVVAVNDLDPFDGRILDLQAILTARNPAALRRAGRRLADIV